MSYIIQGKVYYSFWQRSQAAIFVIPPSNPHAQSVYTHFRQIKSCILLNDLNSELSILFNLIFQCDHETLCQALSIEELYYLAVFLLI
jgi:hypothetical protein